MHFNRSMFRTFADIFVPVFGTCMVHYGPCGSTSLFDSMNDQIIIQIRQCSDFFLQKPYLFPLFDPDCSSQTQARLRSKENSLKIDGSSCKYWLWWLRLGHQMRPKNRLRWCFVKCSRHQCWKAPRSFYGQFSASIIAFHYSARCCLPMAAR